MFKLAKRYPPLMIGALAFFLTACPGDNGPSVAPSIDSFSADPPTVTAGQPVTLTWSVSGNPTGLSIDNGVGAVSGTSEVVTPSATTTYTLTATNSSGSDTETATVTVTGGPVTPPPGGERSLSFGVSASQSGPFGSDEEGNITSPTDPRVLNVAAGSTFYAQVVYSGPNPVTGVTLYLANSNPPGFQADLVPGRNVNGFTLGEALPGCVLDGTQTSVTCVYPVTVAPGTPNITGLEGAGGEFAYVFRTKIADTAGGLPYQQPPRGYVTVGDAGTPPAPPTPPSGFTLSVSKTGSGSGTVTSSPDGVRCGDDCSETYDEGTVVTLTASAADGSAFGGWDGACSGTGSCEVTVDAATSVTAAFSSAPPPDDAFDVSVAEVAPVTLGSDGTASASLDGTATNVPDTGTTTYVWSAEGRGSGNVVFATPSALDTSATFSAAGSYTLRLTATHTVELPGEVTQLSDTVQVVVNPAGGGDAAGPSVTLNEADGQDDPTGDLPIVFTVTFSEPVTGFNRGDVELRGAGAANTDVGDIRVLGARDYPVADYRIEVSGLTASGPVTAAVSANAAANAAGDRSTRSTSDDPTVTYQP